MTVEWFEQGETKGKEVRKLDQGRILGVITFLTPSNPSPDVNPILPFLNHEELLNEALERELIYAIIKQGQFQS